jgi:hypothetical protein
MMRLSAAFTRRVVGRALASTEAAPVEATEAGTADARAGDTADAGMA